MHEMSICEGIIQVLQDQAVSQHYRRVNTVCIEVGALAMVEVDALRFCFEAVARDSLAQGARLDIIELSGQAWCQQCAKTVAITQRYDACAECGYLPLQITQGDELRIKELEVE
ncbi:hydrogenase maturation nickel metallochaperone HypA [Amphritea sp. 1_MG-2023]|uniref:hydrogenase maturation nickel metallochaperone HypA n=1 Tax=Amphritea sp. 1_MG-2023 TaxID=3062670 RepID=UPI0026E14F9F|nr:hydrogenase maturation nickel metallochaperone HypA [Amphritea sp. 1_MG-2023]MDO6565123.1 hydrogenase maturation nickel metallochaperone HypA [Amphritea sp. 1_MG-2023]